MKKLLLVLAIIIILLLCCGSCIGISLLISQSVNSFKDQSAVSFEYYSGDQSALDKILLIKINGTIIDTKDALLVCKKSRAQSVKQIVEKLKEEKRVDLL